MSSNFNKSVVISLWCERAFPLNEVNIPTDYETFANTSSQKWLVKCIDSLRPPAWWSFCRNHWHRIAVPELGAIVLSANLTLALVLIAYLRAFLRMGRQRRPWCRLLLSQLISENVVAFAGLISAMELWLFDFRLSNAACHSKLVLGVGRLALRAVGGALTANHLLLLFGVLDRIQAITKPMVYKLRNECRRCLLANLTAYGTGAAVLLLLLDLDGEQKELCGNGTWATNGTMPENFRDVACIGQEYIRNRCPLKPPDSGLWWYLGVQAKLIPMWTYLKRELWVYSWLSTIWVAIDVCLIIATVVLIVIFRARRKVNGGGEASSVGITGRTSNTERKEERKRQFQLTLTYIFAAGLVCCLAVLNLSWQLYSKLALENEREITYVIAVAILIFSCAAQMVTGTYLLTYLNFRWCPKPQVWTVPGLLILEAVGCLIVSLAIVSLI